MTAALRLVHDVDVDPPDEPPPRERHRPTIDLSAAIREMARAAAAALVASGEEVFLRGAELVLLERAREQDRMQRTPDAPFLHTLAVETVKGLLSHVAYWQGWRPATEKRPAQPYHAKPDHDACRYLLGPGDHRALFPKLEGIVEAPSFRADGSIADTPGHDPASGFLYAPNDAFIPVPNAPSRDDARAALIELLEPLAGFPHLGESERGETLCGPARAAVVAAILTLLAVPAIDGSLPVFVFDASMRRSGKSLQTDVIALIATGRKAPRQSWPEDDEEAEKTLCGYALAGDPLICFDNIGRRFGSAKLEACVTCVPGTTVPFRRFGTQQIVKLPWRTVVMGSGNNVTLSPDMAQRSLVIRIEPDREDPEQRVDFAIAGGADGLRAWVAERRPRLVRAALTILRAWHVAGRPSSGIRAMGGFEAWTAIVPAALVWAGASDPMASIGGKVDGEDADPDTAALRSVLEGWARLEAVIEGAGVAGAASGRGITISEAVRHLQREADAARKGDGPPPDFDDLREALAELSHTPPGRALDATAIGYAFRRHRRRPVAGLRLICPTPPSASRKSRRWTVERP